MEIEVYGIPEELARCHGCISTVRYLERKGLDYTFRPILLPADNDLGFVFDRPLIDDLQRRTGKTTPPTNYPQILVDGKWIGGYLKLKDLLGDDDE